MLTKCIPRIYFDVPKSSFGEHKLVTKDSNNVPLQSGQRIIWHKIGCYHPFDHLANLLQKIAPVGQRIKFDAIMG